VPELRDRARVAYETAITLGREAREVRPKDMDLLAALADAHAVLAKLSDPAASARHAADARALIAAIEALRPQGADVLFTVASTLEELGDRAKALEWLDRAIAAGYPLKSVERSPFLKELRRDAEYVSRLSKARQP
jgi:tetratricopeptide (TPR) repeat protein